jgi:hypothetical protein
MNIYIHKKNDTDGAMITDEVTHEIIKSLPKSLRINIDVPEDVSAPNEICSVSAKILHFVTNEEIFHTFKPASITKQNLNQHLFIIWICGNLEGEGGLEIEQIPF